MRCIERAMVEIEEGRLWKARDRLRGGFVTAPAHQELLNMLGDVLFRMGDLPDAARYWLLTERRDECVAQAEAALRERCGSNPSALAYELPVKANLDEYPESVQHWLRELRTEAQAAGAVALDERWGRRNRRVEPLPARSQALAMMVLFAIVAIFLVGAVTVVVLLWSAVS